MEIINCYVDVVKNKYAYLDGRAGQKEFWIFSLINFIVVAVGMIMSFGPLLPGQIAGLVLLFTNSYINLIFLPQILVGVRRLHDIGKSGRCLLIGLIPILGQIYLLYWFCKVGNPGDNQYRHNANLPENHIREVLNKSVDVLKNKYAKFSGRARRKEYWLLYTGYSLSCSLLALVAYCLAQLSVWISGVAFFAFLPAVLMLLCFLATFIPFLALSVRRLHDVGKSGWWILIAVIPFFGALYLLYLDCQDSEPGENKYGLNPKENPVSLT